MDELIENRNQEEEDEYGVDVNQKEREIEQLIEQGSQNNHSNNQQNNQVNNNDSQSRQNVDLAGRSGNEGNNKMIPEKGNERNNKLRQFQDEVTRITALNFRSNYQYSNGMKQEVNTLDINTIKDAIKMQMEYYFSDTNLIHDTYLRCIIEKSPNHCVDIKLFLKFKRIQQILDPINKGKVVISNSTNIHQNDHNKGQKLNNQHHNSKKDLIHFVRDSLIHSIILKVKKDSLKVKRVFPFHLEQAQHDSKERTLYIDYLPPRCTKQTLVSIFENFNITNINLPLQKNIQLCKGFSFIEFATQEEANQALQTKNSSIPKELILLAEKKIGQGSIRIIPLKKWEEEKKTFKNICSSSNTSSQSSVNVGQKRKQSDEFSEVDVSVERGALIKIINIPPNAIKQEVALAVRHLGFEFYCDYLGNEQSEIDNSEDNKDKTTKDSEMNSEQKTDSKVPQLCSLLKVGQAMIRFKNAIDKQQAVQKALQLNNYQLNIEIKGQQCEIISVVEGEEETNYWNYVKFKKNEFRKFFYLKKLEKKNKSNSNSKN